MRQLFASVALTAAALTGTAAYANNVAVADSQAALFGTAYAKQTAQSLETSVKGQKDRIAALTKEINALQSRFDKDGKLMKPEERTAIIDTSRLKVTKLSATSGAALPSSCQACSICAASRTTNWPLPS